MPFITHVAMRLYDNDRRRKRSAQRKKRANRFFALSNDLKSIALVSSRHLTLNSCDDALLCVVFVYYPFAFSRLVVVSFFRFSPFNRCYRLSYMTRFFISLFPHLFLAPFKILFVSWSLSKMTSLLKIIQYIFINQRKKYKPNIKVANPQAPSTSDTHSQTNEKKNCWKLSI